MDGNVASAQGTITCSSWIKRPENAHLVAMGRSSVADQTSSLQIFAFDRETTSLFTSPAVVHVFEEGCNPVSIAVHPSGDEIVCSTTTGGCKLFELCGQERSIKLLPKDLLPLAGAGPQKCIAFSVDGSRLATGGVDGHLRIFEWPSMRLFLDEPKAHNSFQDMDFSLDSEFLASTSTDGSARIWKTDDGVPLTTLTRDSDERIELCRFSKDGTKPFLFCAVHKGNKSVTAVWDISTWKKIGHKRLLRKPVSMMSISLDGKYLAQETFTLLDSWVRKISVCKCDSIENVGLIICLVSLFREMLVAMMSRCGSLDVWASKDGDVCVVDVKKMEVSHWSKRLHLGSCITSLDFCPSERVVLSTSNEWGPMVTKLNVPADWKAWQIYLLLVGLFLASAIIFYIFFENSDSFWNFPTGRDQPARPKISTILGDPKSDEQNIWNAFDSLDL